MNGRSPETTTAGTGPGGGTGEPPAGHGLGSVPHGRPVGPGTGSLAGVISHFDASLPVLSAQGGPAPARSFGNGYTLRAAALEDASAHLDAATEQAERAAETIRAAPNQFRSLGTGFNTAVRKAQSTATDTLRALASVTSTARAALDQTRRHYATASEHNAGAIGSTFLAGGTGTTGSS